LFPVVSSLKFVVTEALFHLLL